MTPRAGRRKWVQTWVFARSGAAAGLGQRQASQQCTRRPPAMAMREDRSDVGRRAWIETRPVIPRRGVRGAGKRQRAQRGTPWRRQLRCARWDRRQRRGPGGAAARHPGRVNRGRRRLGLADMRGMPLRRGLGLSGNRMRAVLASLGRCAVPRHDHHGRGTAHQRHRQQMQQHREGAQPDRDATGAEEGQRAGSEQRKDGA